MRTATKTHRLISTKQKWGLIILIALMLFILCIKYSNRNLPMSEAANRLRSDLESVESWLCTYGDEELTFTKGTEDERFIQNTIEQAVKFAPGGTTYGSPQLELSGRDRSARTVLKVKVFPRNLMIVGFGTYREAGAVISHYVDAVYQNKIYYYPSGKVRASGGHMNGHRSGLWKFFREDGTVSSEGSFVNGQREGRWIEYDSANEGFTISVFRAGVKISEGRKREGPI